MYLYSILIFNRYFCFFLHPSPSQFLKKAIIPPCCVHMLELYSVSYIFSLSSSLTMAWWEGANLSSRAFFFSKLTTIQPNALDPGFRNRIRILIRIQAKTPTGSGSESLTWGTTLCTPLEKGVEETSAPR